MIHHVWFTPDDDECLWEVPRVELEYTEVPEEEAIVLIPYGTPDKTTKSQYIASSIRAMIHSIQTLPKSPYSTWDSELYTLPQENGEQIEVYIFPKNTPWNSNQRLREEMNRLQQITNILGTDGKRIIIWLLL